jgi:hypothetical protein
MSLPAPRAVVKIAHFEKLYSVKMNGSISDRGHCNSNTDLFGPHNAGAVIA